MRIEFQGIRMAFGGNEVLHNVSFSIAPGAIFALVGENGAGKSTLMNILGGLFPPTAGEILLDGAPARFSSPRASLKKGIAFIHQELNPVNDLTVYENVFLGRELRKTFGRMNRQEMRRQTREILDRMEMKIPEDAPMGKLDASQKQIVAIAGALLFQAKVMIMDEPTTSLAGHEVERLFQLLRKLSREGVTILFISHKLNEIKDLCTEFAVLRNGSLVAAGKTAEVTATQLSELIVGRELSAESTPIACDKRGAEVLELRGLSQEGVFRDVSIGVQAGEILGVTGLLGAGHGQVFRCVFGDVPKYKGQILLDGKPFRPRNTATAIRAGVAYVPSNRKENAIVPDMSVLFNGTLANLKNFQRWGWISRQRQEAEFHQATGPFHLKYGQMDDLITTLSGGNQQKVILGRWLARPPRALILDNPTQGVDVGAKQEIYDIIRQVADSGVAVVVISGEGREIQRLCHRAVIMFHGAIAGELKGPEITEQAIMALATGAKEVPTASPPSTSKRDMGMLPHP